MKMTRSQSFWEDLAKANPEALKFDGPTGDKSFFNDCISGLAKRKPWHKPVLVYSESKMIAKMIRDHHLPFNDTLNWLTINAFTVWWGDGTPLLVNIKNPVAFDSSVR